jgi:hypothetical protein
MYAVHGSSSLGGAVMFELGEILLEAQHHAQYHDGLVTFPAYLLEQMHNILFPETPQHDYTEAA